ncbi:flagellar hook protein FlgE [Pilimelia terevasa]|uniref:Flagellar hook protein FlgE n=1 Tax=Pilimelia terevasa TaxID=53372 RepID=A0A8J3FFH2_9ACTN|nr:flagellar hook protein FlgE [Pilimelia terevasa]GGK18098.1 flagellar hook protein FlgE [Pilimelia terevasa]
MLRSLFSGISGLRAHQTMMDVTGNNIANVNTTGFKGSQATFQDTLSQMVQPAGSPATGLGGTNPAQIGLGVRLGGITTNFTQGATQMTGRSTDLMIQGDGFFAVNNGSETLFTRNGSFSFDANGTMVTNGGMKVQGWQANAAGAINTNANPGPITLPISTLLAPTATATATFSGNLPGNQPNGSAITTSMTVYDIAGNGSTLSVTLTKQAAGWDVSFDGGVTTTGSLTFDGAGAYTGGSPVLDPATGVSVDLDGITAYSGSSTVAPQSQNGSAAGSLQSFTISPDGIINGVYSNGLKQSLGQLTMATFNNPTGLEKAGDSMYRNTVNSGPAQFGPAGTGGRGVLQSGALEMSNVDLAQEFTNLVIAQRGFQANSRVITTSDSLLEDLVNLKR